MARLTGLETISGFTSRALGTYRHHPVLMVFAFSDYEMAFINGNTVSVFLIQ
ncbi:hypothetical protein [Klebsiella pneumoniae IS39]|nr:hypothetical protein [Klebsiella pneumoniae IS39]